MKILLLLVSLSLFGQVKDLAPRYLGAYTVATLPSAASWSGYVAVVTDASVAGSCTSGSGSALALCRSSGSAWVSLGGGTSISGLTDLQVTRTSSTVLGIAAGKARQGATSTSYSAATATLSGTSASSTAYIYISSAAVLTVGHNGATTVTCSGCTTATSVTAFPSDSIPIATATYTSAAWDTSGITDLRAVVARENLSASDGISLAFSSTGAAISTDAATVPRYSTGSGAPSSSCTQGRDYYLDTAASNLYQCTATNTWATVGALPTQTSNAGKHLETNGTAASWQAPVASFKTGDTGDVCSSGGAYTTIYDFAANALAAGDFVRVHVLGYRTGVASTPLFQLHLEGTQTAPNVSMGGDSFGIATADFRIVSTTSARSIGMAQRANGSAPTFDFDNSITIDTTSATGTTVRVYNESCSGGDTFAFQYTIEVIRVAAR